ncbi:PIN domain-containing protein [Algiphilus sp. W345]|uniref:Ribonuclease VapC n=1 Tax=Banduia mediterranea TaxID=3075609 RepID=A0ABU2WG76_9GAMM|nr:PIN domain-containing protein [Algiphilus sp. W345]MDT0496880.1 PIN domain-containing protein [Algiphilus sp. W345]
MIHLDTNALIALPLWAQGDHPLIQRVIQGEHTAASAIVWYEFLCGPVDPDEIKLAEAFIERRIIPVDEHHAHCAAQLFNEAGRKRGLRTDALIAATAMLGNAELLTVNRKDFDAFVPAGLRLMPV